MCSLGLHPIIVAIKEVYFIFGFNRIDDSLDTSFGLQGPVKNQIKALFTTLLLICDMF